MGLTQDIRTCLWKTDTHTYLAPHPLLRPYIAHYTICYCRYLQQTRLYLVPDISGCIVMKEAVNGSLDICYWGPTSVMESVENAYAKDDVLYFVEFLPGGAYAFLQLAQHALCDERIALDQLHIRCYRQLQEAYRMADGETQFFQHLDTIFLSLLQTTDTAMFSLVKHLQQGEKIADVMDRFGYSQRHLQRMVSQQIGCSMKTIQKIQRINMAVELLKHADMPLTEVAYACAYYDQAHFIHEFRSVCLITPQQYRMQMRAYYNEAFKF